MHVVRPDGCSVNRSISNNVRLVGNIQRFIGQYNQKGKFFRFLQKYKEGSDQAWRYFGEL